MEFLTYTEATRALILADLLCRHADEDKAVMVAAADLELVVLGLFLIVDVSGHGRRLAAALTTEEV